jgi:hypothetical protein
METIRIFLLCVLAAAIYGIVHDQVTARICVEYFTIGHPRLIESESPTALGLLWGVIATWWAGAIVGVGLALAARLGGRPKVSSGRLIVPLARLLIAMGVLAAVAGCSGYFAAARGWVWLVGDLAAAVPRAAHARFIACLWTHLASYGGGFLGGATLCVMVWRGRRVRKNS